jgi:hypothetical protein
LIISKNGTDDIRAQMIHPCLSCQNNRQQRRYSTEPNEIGQ